MIKTGYRVSSVHAIAAAAWHMTSAHKHHCHLIRRASIVVALC